jgi:hypothetical protein
MPSAVYSLFWYLNLAHWLGDYPFQSNWIAQRKTNFWVLILHVSIHFLLLAVILYPATARVWPYLLALVAIHFALDAAKNWFKIHRPTWVTGPYLVDQALHISLLAGVAFWMAAEGGAAPVALPLTIAILGSGLVLVTYVWMISEKVLWTEGRLMMIEAPHWGWSRLAMRAGFYLLVLAGRQALAPVAMASMLWLPYTNSAPGKRALFFDLCASLVISAVINLALPG